MARKTQEEIDARIAALGGGGLSHGTAGQKQIKNPNYNPNDLRSTEQEYLTLDIQQWQSPSGHTLQAYQLPDGSWEVIQDEPAAPKPASAATTGSTDLRIPPGGRSETQGTPIRDANGTITGWDNNRPRRVVYDKDGNVVGSQELEGTELTAWRNAQQANQSQTNTSENPVTGRPGWTEIKTEVKTSQGTTTRSQFRGPNGNVVDTLPPSEADRLGKPTGNTRTTSQGGRTVKETEYLLPDGTKEWRSQTETTEPDRVGKPTGNTRTRTENGATVKESEYILADGTREWRTQTAPIEGQRQLPAGMPTLDTSTAEKARQSYLTQVAWVQQQVTGGTMSSKEAVDLLNPSKDAAESVIKAEQDRISNERQARTQDIQQEGNRLSASTAQFANSRLGVDEIAKYAPRGGTQAGTAYLTNLLTQGLMNQSTRGNVGAASPTPQVAPLPNPNAMSELAQPGDPPLEPTGSAMLDGMAARAAEQARAAAAVGPERAAEIRGNPVFRPTAPMYSPVFQNSAGTFGLPDPAPATPPAVQGTPSPLGDTGAPPVSMMDPSTLPPFLRNLYGRSVLDQILGGGYA